MNPYLACVQASAKSYAAYYRWTGPVGLKGFEMHRAKADMEMYGAIYRVKRRKEYLNKLITAQWKLKS